MNILSVANKVKTPLALSGLVVIVLYLIVKQILSLNVFSNIGSSSTFILLQNILDKVFWLAVITIFLGIGSYIFSTVLSHKVASRSSNVELVDARVNPEQDGYEEVPTVKGTLIQPKKRGK